MNELTAQEVDWSDPSIKYEGRNDRDIDRFILKAKGEKARICILSSKVQLVKVHYLGDKEAGGRQRTARCRAQEADGCPACEAGDEPKNRFATNIIRYETDNSAKPSGWTPGKDACRYRIQLWTFGNDKFVSLREVKEQWGEFNKRDLIVTSVEPTYHKLDITPTPEAWWRAGLDKEGIGQFILQYKEKVYDLLTIMGKIYTRDQMEQMMKGEDATPAARGSTGPTPSGAPKPAAPEEAPDEVISEADFDTLLADI